MSRWRKGEANAECVVCGEPFHAAPARIARGCDRFYSKDCYARHLRDRGSVKKYVGGRKREHVRIVESEIGPIPIGWQVHHVNERKRDNRPENLVACDSTRAHALLHKNPLLLAYAKWSGETARSVRIFNLAALEKSTVTKLCAACWRFLPRSNFGKERKYRDGLRGVCFECRKTSGWGNVRS